MKASSRTMTYLTAAMLALIASVQARASADFQSIARLFGPTALKGKAVYEERDRNGTLEQRFKVELQNGIPGTTHVVRVNSTIVGSITINSLGRGKLQLRTAQFINDPGDGQPIPNGFPRLDTGDVVRAGKLTGVVFDNLDTSAQNYRLEGEFGNNGSAKYQEHFDDGLLEREFEVEVEHQLPNKVLPVYVRGKLVGSIRTNSLGRGRLEMRTPSFIESPADGVPMPNTFPSLRSGDEVKVGSMTTQIRPRT
jgi:hypothetical protein